MSERVFHEMHRETLQGSWEPIAEPYEDWRTGSCRR